MNAYEIEQLGRLLKETRELGETLNNRGDQYEGETRLMLKAVAFYLREAEHYIWYAQLKFNQAPAHTE